MISEEINYQREKELAPRYRLDQFTQQIGGTIMPAPLTMGQSTIFELPPVVFNLSKSSITYRYNIPASAVGNGCNMAFINTCPLINQIQYYAKNGQPMFDCINIDRYMKMTMGTDVKIEDMLSYDASPPVVAAPGAAYGYTGSSIIQKNNTTVTYAPAPGVSIGDIRSDGIPFDQSIVEPRDVITGTQVTALQVDITLDLNLIKNSIFSLDKDLYFGDISYLKIWWRTWSDAGFVSVNGIGAVNTALAAGQAFGLTNLYLYLAVEVNPSVQLLHQNLFEKNGFNIPIDYIYPSNFPFVVGTSDNFYNIYGPGQGQRLKRVYWTAYKTAPNPNELYNNSNLTVGGGAAFKISSFYTQLDSQRIIQYNIDTTGAAPAFQDYYVMRDKLKDSCLQSRNVYQYNWVWVDSWDNMKLSDHNPNLITGLPLDVNHKYEVNATTNVAFPLTFYMFAITQKTLIITKLGVQVI
jgi:hypothetical protein